VLHVLQDYFIATGRVRTALPFFANTSGFMPIGLESPMAGMNVQGEVPGLACFLKSFLHCMPQLFGVTQADKPGTGDRLARLYQGDRFVSGHAYSHKINLPSVGA
jgi:hypothetical protein